ncbi:MAG: proteasome alpha subunit [Fimbriimonadaceae bacterium]|nr:proteasome alpha subunit [Fimbriimonadaceae bacterium]
MFTPYDWQESMGNRASYIEGKLSQGSPAIAVSIDAGILVLTYRRQARKIYEIYDRLIFAAIGQQSDVESLRTAAVEFTHQEGYNRSEQDVTIQRVAAALSGPLKRAFADFQTAPFVARALFGEVHMNPEEDLYYTLDYDGNFTVSRRHAFVAGTDTIQNNLRTKLADFNLKTTPEKAVEQLKEIWAASLDPENEEKDDEQVGDLKPDAVLLERGGERENRFRDLTPEQF